MLRHRKTYETGNKGHTEETQLQRYTSVKNLLNNSTTKVLSRLIIKTCQPDQ